MYFVKSDYPQAIEQAERRSAVTGDFHSVVPVMIEYWRIIRFGRDGKECEL